MNRNYMIYPMKYMRITQTYLGGVSHLKHTTGTPKDYPIDEAGKDTGRDAVYCPCDEMVVTQIKGYGNSKITNTIWLVSTNTVVTPTFEDIAFMSLTHENDSDLKKIKVGDRFKRGEIICYEGTDGASANHIHIVAGQGNSNNWEKSTTGSWVISGNTKKPEEVFFVDLTFTTVLSNGNLNFKILKNETIGTPVPKNTTVNQLEIIVDNLRVRTDAGVNQNIVGYIKKGIYNYTEKKEKDQYTWYKIDSGWVAYQDTWMNIYPKEEIEDEEIEELIPIEESPRLIFTSKESKYYKIFLKENAKLYFKDA